MRMRRKKNLDARMENVKDYILAVETEEFFAKTQEERFNILTLKDIFGNENPLHLELGCGKGGFAIEMAKKYPNINFIAVEKISNIIVAGAEELKESGLKNLRFLNVSAENMLYYLKPKSVERIYLNFSCPYPKGSYANHRLTSERFLKLYKQLLTGGGYICQKTDNMHLFEYSLESYSKCGYYLENVSLDLHKSNFKDNVMTEYETKFSAMGLPIYRVEAYPDK